MPSVLPRYTLRVSQEMLDKIRYIADDGFRTMNKEIESLLARRIEEYEREHGPIKLTEE
jgi:Arc-like DNA binding domain.